MTSRRTRRAVLASGAAGLASLAGCATPPGTDESTTDGTTPSPSVGERPLSLGSTYRFADGPSVTVTDARVVTHLPYLVNPERVAVTSVPGELFLFADVAIEGATTLDLLGPRLLLDGVRHDPARQFGQADLSSVATWETDFYRPYREDHGGGTVGFAIPAPTAVDDAAVVYERSGTAVRWNLPSAIERTLAAPASFSVVAVDAPDEVPRGERATASLTVRNDGGSAGTFRASVRGKRQGIGGTILAGTVPANDRERIAVEVPPSTELNPDYEDASSVTYAFDWGTGRRSATVRIGRGADSHPLARAVLPAPIE